MSELMNQSIELALITARGGSKGMPGKNIINLAGKPLIFHTINAARQSGVFRQIVVSTDDATIAEVSRTAGAEVLMRPVELAQDHSSSLDVIEHALAEYGLTGGRFCLLQPTSPLRNATHIREAAAILIASGAPSVISVTEPEHHPLKTLVLHPDGRYEPVRRLQDLVSPRQALPKAIVPNGAIYFCCIEKFIFNNNFFIKGMKPYFMSKITSIDIDSMKELKISEKYLLKNKKLYDEKNKRGNR